MSLKIRHELALFLKELRGVLWWNRKMIVM